MKKKHHNRYIRTDNMLDIAEKSIAIKKPAIDIKATVKDSVFRDLFGTRKYALQLYKAIHPEDADVTEDDISNVTIDNILTDQQYNDLGMMVRGTLLVLLEAQSTWSVNIIIRILLYLAYTWNRYIEDTKQNRYGSVKLKLPKPEFYVIYTGGQKKVPEWIHLSKEFFREDGTFLEMNVRIFCGNGGEDIISQYVEFTNVYTEQIKIYGRTRKAVMETIQICWNRNILKEYLESREKEVIDIMMALFDQEKALEQYMEQFGNEREQKGEIKERQKNIRSMSKFLSAEKIAEILSIPIEEVKLSLGN
jgi:hypothetical protein